MTWNDLTEAERAVIGRLSRVKAFGPQAADEIYHTACRLLDAPAHIEPWPTALHDFLRRRKATAGVPT